jgi:hypothetical protein
MQRIVFATVVLVSVARCATMVNDTTEKIPVRSEPAGAVVSIECGSAPIYGGVTPTVITVPRAAQPCGITIAKEGYVETRVKFERQFSRAGAANKVAAAPVGILFGLVGMALAGAAGTSSINPDAIGNAGYDIGTSIGAMPANKIDEKSGGAYKQVPGEVNVTLERKTAEVMPPVPPR